MRLRNQRPRRCAYAGAGARLSNRSLNDEAAYAPLQEADPRLGHPSIRDTARERAMASLRFQFDPLWHFTASLLLVDRGGHVHSIVHLTVGSMVARRGLREAISLRAQR